MNVQFRPLRAEDLPRVARWLATDHVRRWWLDPSDLDAVEAKYLPCIRGDDPTAIFLIISGDTPVGLIQSYRLVDEPDWSHSLEATGVEVGAAAGIDYFIGEVDVVGRGIGSAAIVAFTAEVYRRYPDVDQIIVTPQLANRASCRVLEKAGYKIAWTGQLESDHPSDADTAALYVHHRDRERTA